MKGHNGPSLICVLSIGESPLVQLSSKGNVIVQKGLRTLESLHLEMLHFERESLLERSELESLLRPSVRTMCR